MIIFEGVSVTAVVLAPGTYGTAVPSCRYCHHFATICGIRRVFQNCRSCRYAHDVGASELTLTPANVDLHPAPPQAFMPRSHVQGCIHTLRLHDSNARDHALTQSSLTRSWPARMPRACRVHAFTALKKAETSL